jgi:hypothetical protein
MKIRGSSSTSRVEPLFFSFLTLLCTDLSKISLVPETKPLTKSQVSAKKKSYRKTISVLVEGKVLKAKEKECSSSLSC